MTFVYNEFKRAVAAAEIDFDAPDDFRIILVMTNTTADTEDDANTIDGFTTLDEFDGSDYSRQSLGSDTLNEDSVNSRAEYDAADAVFAELGYDNGRFGRSSLEPRCDLGARHRRGQALQFPSSARLAGQRHRSRRPDPLRQLGHHHRIAITDGARSTRSRWPGTMSRS